MDLVSTPNAGGWIGEAVSYTLTRFPYEILFLPYFFAADFKQNDGSRRRPCYYVPRLCFDVERCIGLFLPEGGERDT